MESKRFLGESDNGEGLEISSQEKTKRTGQSEDKNGTIGG